MVSARTATVILGVWVALLLVTHSGPRSPYTYAAQAAALIQQPVTRTVNPDAMTVYPVTRFFYDGTLPRWETAHNLFLPAHSFVTSTVAAFVRRYMTANNIVNWLFMMLLTIAAMRAAQRYGIRIEAMLLGLGTIYALPPFIGYLGQPMQYIVGPVINYLIVLAALMLPEEDLRNPLIAAAMTAILTLNYDWYLFAAALAVYLIFYVRFRSRRDVLAYLFLSLVPLMAWKWFLDFISGGTISALVREVFFASILADWSDYLADPLRRPLLPFTVAHIGAHIALHQVIALIWWPLIVCCAIALWKGGRQALLPVAPARLLMLLVVLYALQQLATAAFDDENNPRRALPLFFAFACAWCWAIHRNLGRKGWTIAFVSLFALTAFLAFADVLLKTPQLVTLSTGEAIRHEPKIFMPVLSHRIEIPDVPDAAQAVVRGSFPRARLGAPLMPFFAAQLFVGFVLISFFWILARAALLPRLAPHAFVALWLASFVARFLV